MSPGFFPNFYRGFTVHGRTWTPVVLWSVPHNGRASLYGRRTMLARSCHQKSVCAVTLLVIAALLGVGRSLFAATAPTTYSAYTGTDAKPIPSAPVLGAANSIISDP